MIIIKLRKPYPYHISWTPIDDWLWIASVSISATYVPPSEFSTLGYTFDGYNETSIEIGDVVVDDKMYVQTASKSSSALVEESWYFDITNHLLYVHVNHGKRMDSSDFDSLQVNGYSDGNVFYDENDILYTPHLSSSIQISDKVDRLRFQKMSMKSNSLTFDNSGGEFNYIFKSPVPGADVNILFISEEDRKAGKKILTPIYTGYVKGQTITSTKYTVKLADKREQMNGQFPNTVFDSTNYPDMESKYMDDLIPEGYGDLLGVPAFCTNGTITSGDVTYKYATDGTALTTVYVKTDDVWTAVTPTANSPTACTFTLATGDGRDPSGRYRKAKVDCTLREQENPADILADMIYRYFSISFIGDNYNISEWENERALLSDISYYIDKKQEFYKLVEPLQNGSTLNFIFRIDASGKFTIKVDDITRSVSQIYEAMDNLSDTRQVTTDFIDYATSVDINYSKDQESGKTAIETVDTYKEDTIDIYRFDQELTFDSLLNTRAEAEEKGENILMDYKKARDKHTIIVSGIMPQALLDVYVYNSSIYLGLELLQEYAGIVAFKVTEYSLDFIKERTTLTGYDITDITEIIGKSGQGNIHFNDLYGIYTTHGTGV